MKITSTHVQKQPLSGADELVVILTIPMKDIKAGNKVLGVKGNTKHLARQFAVELTKKKQ